MSCYFCDDDGQPGEYCLRHRIRIAIEQRKALRHTGRMRLAKRAQEAEQLLRDCKLLARAYARDAQREDRILAKLEFSIAQRQERRKATAK